MSNSFDTVRISSHGDFIDKPLFIYQRPKYENEITNYVTFNIYFRGDIGNLVYPRCNTLSDNCRSKGKKYCKSDKQLFQDKDGMQTNGLHHMVSNMDHEIFYENEVKKSKGMILIDFEQTEQAIDKVLMDRCN